MSTTICSVFTPRGTHVPLGDVLENRIYTVDGVRRQVWLNNGGGVEFQQTLQQYARRCERPVVLLQSPWILSIARAHNRVLDVASEQEGDMLELQDDVLAGSAIVPILQDAEYDIVGAWHSDRPFRQHEMDGIPYCVGMCLLIRRHVFERLGYHDEGIFAGVDAEYGCRAFNEGFKVGYIEKPRVHHLGDFTTSGDNDRQLELHRTALILLRQLHAFGVLNGRREICNSDPRPVITRENFV